MLDLAWQHALRQICPPALDPTVATPIAFGENYSRGQFQRARHLELIEQTILTAIDKGGRVIISVSVRHGKTVFGSRWIPAWYLGKNPDKRVLHATHTAELGRANSRAARDILTEHGPDLFGVKVARDSTAADRWDLAGHAGGMLSLGVGGAPIGRGGDLTLVDDPYKSYADAMSPTTRQNVVEWWTGTMESRIEPGGAVVILMARWHPDDLAGFLLANAPDEWTEVKLPAICTDADADPLGREVGEALWPDRYPAAELERRRVAVSLALGSQIWDSQYQQDPRPRTGGMFPEDRWEFIVEGDVPVDTVWCRGWDLAATEDAAADYTAGARLGLMPDGRVVVADVVRGQWSSDKVRTNLTSTAAADPVGTHIELPQDPGQAGKDQAQQLVRLLAGYSVRALPQTGSKELRATPLSAQVLAGNVVLLRGPWNGAWIGEAASFPGGHHDDQVDAAATAYNALVRGHRVGEADVWADDRLTGRR